MEEEEEKRKRKRAKNSHPFSTAAHQSTSTSPANHACQPHREGIDSESSVPNRSDESVVRSTSRMSSDCLQSTGDARHERDGIAASRLRTREETFLDPEGGSSSLFATPGLRSLCPLDFKLEPCELNEPTAEAPAGRSSEQVMAMRGGVGASTRRSVCCYRPRRRCVSC